MSPRTDGTRSDGTPSSPRRPRSRWRRRALVGAALLALLWVTAATVLLASAAVDARSAKAGIDAARARYSTDELVEGDGLAAVERARARFASAEARSGSPALAPLTVLPVVGRQVRSFHALAGAGAEVLQVAVDAAGDIEALRTGVLEPSQRAVAVEQLHRTAVRAGHRLRSVRLGPEEALVAPLADARAAIERELAEALTSVDQASVVTAGVAQVLEGSRYLVLAANNAEMQTGWGMPLSVGVLEVDDGSMRLDAMEATGSLLLPVEPLVPVPGDFGDRWGFMRPSQDFRNLALTADFHQAAPVAATMWEALGRGRVDGVIVIDPIALQAIVASTGPVQLEDRMVAADGVVPLLLHDAYVEQADEVVGREVRRERQSDLAVAAVVAATAPGTDLIGLARNLAQAAGSRHLLAWSSVPEQQAAWEAVGADGALRHDSLLVGAANRAGNKLDWFLDVSASLQSTASPAGAEIALTLELTNRTPDGEPSYVAGPYGDPSVRSGPVVPAGDWRGFLTVHLPGGARDAHIDDHVLAVDGPSGQTRVIATVVQVPKGSVATYTVRFILPPGSETVRVEPSARVHPISWQAAGERWTDDAGARVVSLAP